MRQYLITIFWGLFVWLFATLFFVFFGEYVLFSPQTEKFITSILLLLVGTALLLWLVTKIYVLFDRSKHALLKFGIIGSIIGLALDTFSISNHHRVFPKLDETQIIAFTAWMSFAYALYLLIPGVMYFKRIKTWI